MHLKMATLLDHLQNYAVAANKEPTRGNTVAVNQGGTATVRNTCGGVDELEKAVLRPCPLLCPRRGPTTPTTKPPPNGVSALRRSGGGAAPTPPGAGSAAPEARAGSRGQVDGRRGGRRCTDLHFVPPKTKAGCCCCRAHGARSIGRQTRDSLSSALPSARVRRDK